MSLLIVASLPLECPKQFEFSSLHEWPQWIHRFNRFWDASGLSSKPEDHQVNTPIYTMGNKADNMLTSFRLSSDNRKKYSGREIQSAFRKETQYHLQVCEVQLVTSEKGRNSWQFYYRSTLPGRTLCVWKSAWWNDAWQISSWIVRRCVIREDATKCRLDHRESCYNGPPKRGSLQAATHSERNCTRQ